MRKDLIPTMEEFNSMSKDEQIETLCLVHECSERKRKIHHRLYLEQWNPHPPQQFMQWWPQVGWLKAEKATERPWKELEPVVAFNCQVVREIYREGKQTGTLWERPK